MVIIYISNCLGISTLETHPYEKVYTHFDVQFYIMVSIIKNKPVSINHVTVIRNK
jgi:hypothetical protein